MRDGFSAYLSWASKHHPISVENEHDLAVRVSESNDPDAIHQLMLANLRYVVKVALEYRSYGCELNDLVQAGNLGMAEAIQRFDPSRGTRLMTYASWWIRDAIRQKIAASRSVSARGTTRAERTLVSGKVEGGVGRDIPLDWVEPAMQSTNLPPDEELIRCQEQQRLKKAVEMGLDSLDPREQIIIKLRFLSDKPASLASLGLRFGISRERARQLAERARKKLANQLSRQGFSCEQQG